MCIVICTLLLSRPARGAWVEMYQHTEHNGTEESRPARGAWVEISCISCRMSTGKSRPARGAWVEILLLWIGSETRFVAPRKGRVG